jgi:hypothetical protein
MKNFLSGGGSTLASHAGHLAVAAAVAGGLSLPRRFRG